MKFFSSPIDVVETGFKEQTGIELDIGSIDWRKTLTDGNLIKGIVALGAVAATAGVSLPVAAGASGLGMQFADKLVAAKEKFNEAKQYGQTVSADVLEKVQVFDDIELQADLGDFDANTAKDVLNATAELRKVANVRPGEPLPVEKRKGIFAVIDSVRQTVADTIKKSVSKPDTFTIDSVVVTKEQTPTRADFDESKTFSKFDLSSLPPDKDLREVVKETWWDRLLEFLNRKWP